MNVDYPPISEIPEAPPLPGVPFTTYVSRHAIVQDDAVDKIFKDGKPFDAMLVSVQVVDGDIIDRLPNARMTDDAHYLSLRNKFLAEEEDIESQREVEGYDYRDYNRTCTAVLYMINEAGYQVSAKVQGFRPYMFLKCSKSSPAFMASLKKQLERMAKAPPGSITMTVQQRREMRIFKPSPTDKWEKKGDFTQRKHRYLKVSFPSVYCFQTLAKQAKYKKDITVYVEGDRMKIPFAIEESRVEPEHQVLEEFSVRPHEWLHFAHYRVRENPCTHCDIEIATNMSQISKSPRTGMAPVMIAAYDIECFSERGDKFFCDATRPGDEIYNICTSFCFVGDLPPKLVKQGIEPGETFLRVGQVSLPCNDIPNVVVDVCDSEASLLNRFRDMLMLHVRPDGITGWNSWGFDDGYVAHRAKMTKAVRAQFMERLVASLTEMKAVKATGMNGPGSKVMMFDHMIRFDMVRWDRDNKKRVNGSKLSAVAKDELGDDKDPIKHTHINEAFRTKLPDDVTKIVAYCFKDADLTRRLMTKMGTAMQYLQEARIFCTPMDKISSRGQQLRVRNSLLRTGHERGFVMNAMYDQSMAPTEKYGGGTVLKPEPAFHEDPILVLDFKSLYPSIMMGWNICYSTFVPPDKVEEYEAMGIPMKHIKCKTGTHSFVQDEPGGSAGILPAMEKKLASARKVAKRAMAAAREIGDSNMVKQKDCEQKACKVSMNAAYGMCGVAKNGTYSCLPVAETITETGGRCLHMSIDHVESTTPYKVIYGDTDSIMVKCPGVSLVDSIAIGNRLAKELTALFPPPMEMEFEDVCPMFLSLRSKMYVKMCLREPTVEWAEAFTRGEKTKTVTVEIEGEKKERTFDVATLNFKGIRNARRDVCVFVKNLFTSLMNALFEGGPDLVLRVLQEKLHDLVYDKLPLSEYITTAALNDMDSYKPGQFPPLAVTIAWACEKKCKGSSLQLGDRVPAVPVVRADTERIIPPPGVETKFKTNPRKSDKNLCDQCYMRHPDELDTDKFGEFVDRTWCLDHQFLTCAVSYYFDIKNEIKEVIRRAKRDIIQYDIKRGLREGICRYKMDPEKPRKFVKRTVVKRRVYKKATLI